jgi:glycosyltransferase involved in cell wall biosynthesis
MNVLLISQVDPPIHGQAVMAALLLEQSKKWSEHNFFVINSAYTEKRADLGAFSFIKALRWLRFVARALGIMSAKDVDVVIMTHSFFRGPFLKDSVFVWLARLLKKKIIVWVHMDPSRLDWQNLPGWLSSYVRACISIPVRWVACSPSLIETWPSAFERDKITAICNGIPDPLTTDLSSEMRPARVVFLSAMTDEKGWRELFKVAENVCRDNPQTCFDFYGAPGAGETEASIVDFFARSSFRDQICWHGSVTGENKTRALLQASLFCLPSWTEAFPLVVLEAMACGLPVIATNVGGVRDAIVDGENGWLCEPKNVSNLEETVRYALNNPTLLYEIGLANRRAFLSRFSDHAFGSAWHKLLDAV